MNVDTNVECSVLVEDVFGLAVPVERRQRRQPASDGRCHPPRKLIPTDPAVADELLARLRVDATDAVGEIRRLVYDLRPPALDELGLVAALEQQFAAVRTSTGGPMHVFVHARELPSLPASIEVAAYRVALRPSRTQLATAAAIKRGSNSNTTMATSC